MAPATSAPAAARDSLTGGLKLLAEGPLDASSESPRPARRARQ
ncbi:hypothetical protein ACIRO3_15360 [Streptomyces sp. NPDC102278]